MGIIVLVLRVLFWMQYEHKTQLRQPRLSRCLRLSVGVSVIAVHRLNFILSTAYDNLTLHRPTASLRCLFSFGECAGALQGRRLGHEVQPEELVGHVTPLTCTSAVAAQQTVH